MEGAERQGCGVQIGFQRAPLEAGSGGTQHPQQVECTAGAGKIQTIVTKKFSSKI